MSPAVPESRSYVHITCGAATEVGGHHFSALADPLSHPARTWCANCAAVLPLAEFRWEDCEEPLPAWHARHAARFSPFARALGGRTAGLVCFVLGGGAALAAARLLLGRSDGTAELLVVVGGVVAAVVGGAAGLLGWDGFVKPRLVHSALGVSDCRALL